LFQHDKARAHISQITRDAIEKLDLAILVHLLFSPEEDFHLSSKMKKDLHGYLCDSDEEVGMSMEFFVTALRTCPSSVAGCEGMGVTVCRNKYS
jgi:hypothetical protein